MDSSPALSKQFTDLQKKQLEKVNQRLFDNGQITDEGKHLCIEADVTPADIIVKTLDQFKQEANGVGEVAKIRFDHYQIKRLSKYKSIVFIYDELMLLGKLANINRLIEQMQAQKRLDAENAEKEYQRKMYSVNQNDIP